MNSVLSEDRPKISASLTNVQNATAQLLPLLDNLKTTMNQANDALSHLDSVLVANNEDIRTIVVELKQTLSTRLQHSCMQSMNSTDHNADNIDETLLNIRATTENMRELTGDIEEQSIVPYPRK